MKITKKHKAALSASAALSLAGLAIAQHTSQSLTIEEIESQIPTVSPYTAQGYSFYEKLSESEHFEKITSRLQQKREQLSANELTNLATLHSLKAWHAQEPQKQLELFHAADTAFDHALKKSPDHWDAWMGKADLYAHSNDPSTEKHAILLLKQLLSHSATSSDYKRAQAQNLLNKLQQKHR